jgi:hypothetical protein
MRRILTAAVASSLLALALPAAASAHHSARHGAVQHHRRHHHRAHTVVFTAGSVRTMPGTTAPTTPSGSEPAATITSFENGVLKLTLADGSTVTGKVTERTEIECRAASQQTGDDNEGNDEGGDEGGPGSGDDQGTDSHDGPAPSSFSQDHGDDEQGGNEEGGTCGVSSLTPGANVAEADLAVTSGGSFWEKIELA